MKRKDFLLKGGLGFIGISTVIDACKKESVENAASNFVSHTDATGWQCNKNGYYSGYTDSGFLGIKNYTGKTWLRGFQLTNNNGVVHFTTVYPGWYRNRATHIHFEVFINKVLKKTGQIAFPETTNNNVYATPLYSAHGPNPTKNIDDNVFGNSATDLANETVVISTRNNILHGNYTIGIPL